MTGMVKIQFLVKDHPHHPPAPLGALEAAKIGGDKPKEERCQDRKVHRQQVTTQGV
jgi:hypothetical protein